MFSSCRLLEKEQSTVLKNELNSPSVFLSKKLCQKYLKNQTRSFVKVLIVFWFWMRSWLDWIAQFRNWSQWCFGRSMFQLQMEDWKQQEEFLLLPTDIANLWGTFKIYSVETARHKAVGLGNKDIWNELACGKVCLWPQLGKPCPALPGALAPMAFWQHNCLGTCLLQWQKVYTCRNFRNTVTSDTHYVC